MPSSFTLFHHDVTFLFRLRLGHSYSGFLRKSVGVIYCYGSHTPLIVTLPHPREEYLLLLILEEFYFPEASHIVSDISPWLWRVMVRQSDTLMYSAKAYLGLSGSLDRTKPSKSMLESEAFFFFRKQLLTFIYQKVKTYLEAYRMIKYMYYNGILFSKLLFKLWVLHE